MRPMNISLMEKVEVRSWTAASASSAVSAEKMPFITAMGVELVTTSAVEPTRGSLEPKPTQWVMALA